MKCCTGFPKAVLPVAAGCFAGKIISPFYWSSLRWRGPVFLKLDWQLT
jgi:hypothetical protein